MSGENDATSTQLGKKKITKPTHPSTSEMVITAIKELNIRGGTSLPAIKKFITENYEVKMETLAPLIKTFLRNSIKKGILIRTRGQGIAGSFQLCKELRRHVGKPRKKVNKPKKAQTYASRLQPVVEKEKGKLFSVGGVVVRNEPVKEDFLDPEPELIDDESDDDEVEFLEEDVLVKDEDSTDEDEDVAGKKEL